MSNYLQRESNKITIANFYEGYQLNRYNFDPPYQRRSLWTEEKKSFLIDSIIKNFPMPPIFLHQKIDDDTGKTTYDVIDGKQRLTAILEFINNEIPIADEVADELEINRVAGKYFENLENELFEYKSRFWRYVIPVEYVDTGNSKIIDSIFDRLNRNGEPLTGQELRNSNYYGTPLLNTIEKVAKIAFWQDRLNRVDRTRMEDIEFISELAFLVLEDGELQSDQRELDRLYGIYANKSEASFYEDLREKLIEVSNYMQSLNLDYEKRKIGGVSHIYGLFAFSRDCVKNNISASSVRTKLNEFFDKWQAKEYKDPLVSQYKDSMSARTKDRGQRRKRTEALINYCIPKT